MRRALLLALLLSGCAPEGCTSFGFGFRVGEKVPESPRSGNAIESYGWDLEYWASDATTTTWNAHGGNGANLTRQGSNNPTLNISTSGVNSAGLPADLVDSGLTPGINSGFTAASQAWDSTNGWHLRMIFQPDLGATDRAFRLLTSGTDYIQMVGAGDGTVLNLDIRDTGLYANQITGLTDGGGVWWLFDAVYDPDAGQLSVYINGEDQGLASGTTDLTPTSPAAFGLTSLETGTTEMQAIYVFWGVREGATITEAQHDADAALLGLEGTTP